MGDLDANALIGKVVDGRYRIESVAGQGGMGVVFRAVQTSVQRPVAMKTLHPQLAASPTFFERFKREAELVCRLNHPNIITVFDFGKTTDGLCYYVMELLEGESLRERVKRDGPMTLRHAAAIIEQVALGVGHAHKHGVIHRDLKPHNVMLSLVDGHEYVKVLDFGLVKAMEQEDEEQLTSTGQVLGTPQYMPPEQAGGERVDQRSDLYAVTAVFYSCLTGRSPFGANTVRKALQASLTQKPTPIAKLRLDAPVPETIEQFCHLGLAPDPNERYQSAEAFIEALHRALAGVPDSVLDALPRANPEKSKESTSDVSTASRRSPSVRAVSAVNQPERPVAVPAGKPLVATSRRLAIGAAVLVVVVGLGLAAAVGLRAPPRIAPTPAPTPAAPLPPAVVSIHVTIKTQPDGAEVIEDGALLGTTPLALDWPRASRRTLRFRLAGHAELEKDLKLEADQTLEFTLEPVRKAAPTPTPKPPPGPRPDEIRAFE